MKKPILIFSLMLFTGVLFTSCKDKEEREENVTEIDQIGSEETGMDEIASSEFSQYDSNRDGLYDRNEFGETYKNEFNTYDQDSDGSLNEEEFYASTYKTIDKNQDSSITEDEWRSGNQGILKERAGDKQMSAFDTNNDKKITLEEWRQGFGESDWFVTYDANKDELIQKEEWNAGFFDDWDLDNDGSLNEEEFNSFSSNKQSKNDTTQTKKRVPQEDQEK